MCFESIAYLILAIDSSLNLTRLDKIDNVLLDYVHCPSKSVTHPIELSKVVSQRALNALRDKKRTLMDEKGWKYNTTALFLILVASSLTC